MDNGHVRLEGVTKTFRLNRATDVRALEQVNFEIKAGELVALVGPSGCGKSTLLRLVAGLEAPTSGSITVGGLAPLEMARRHELGVAFQDHALLPWLTVTGNVALPFRLAGLPVDTSRVDHLLSLVGLTEFGAARPRQLSGGMRQRVSIARALVLEPKLMLLDEPFGALDLVTRRGLNIELQRIWRSSRPTTLLVTHSVDEAVFLGSRVVVMAAGPGRVHACFDIDLGDERTPETTRSAEYLKYVAEVTAALDETLTTSTG